MLKYRIRHGNTELASSNMPKQMIFTALSQHNGKLNELQIGSLFTGTDRYIEYDFRTFLYLYYTKPFLIKHFVLQAAKENEKFADWLIELGFIRPITHLSYGLLKLLYNKRLRPATVASYQL